MANGEAMDELGVADDEAQNEIQVATSAAEPKEISPEFLARFMVPAQIAYSEARAKAEQGKAVDYIKMMKEVEEKGIEYIDNLQHTERSYSRFKPYRRFIKALFLYALHEKAKRNKKLMRPTVTLSHNEKFKKEHIDILKMCFYDKDVMYKLRRIWQSAWYLCTKEMHHFFDLISRDTGDPFDMGSDGEIKIIDRATWNLRSYFIINFFPSSAGEENRMKFQKLRYLVLIKLITDSTIFGAKNKRKFAKKHTERTRSKAVTNTVFKNTAVCIELVYTAWDITAIYMGFINIEEMLKYFLYYHQRTGKLRVLASNRVFSNAGDPTIPVKPGKRKEGDVQLETRTETIEEVAQAAETMGIGREELEDDDVLKHMNAETFEFLVEMAKEFTYDVYEQALAPELQEAK